MLTVNLILDLEKLQNFFDKSWIHAKVKKENIWGIFSSNCAELSSLHLLNYQGKSGMS